MCTVSFVPLQNGFLLTSNRDEKIYRPTIAPKIYSENDIKLLYPKDEKAGGTWIVAKEDGTTIILLNGAFINHQKKPNYSKSRGVILMEIIQAQFPLIHFQEMNLDNIEPFTLIIFQNNILTEVKWDEVEKHIIEKSIKKPHIWSSATLYNRIQRIKRKQWFEDFCRYNMPLSIDKILSFHTNTKATNTEFGLVINREDKTKTVSITQLLLKNDKLEMTYIDRINNKTIEKIAF
ncbi:MAG: NRDE family protein [Flavobacterium sp.]|uniref:NRDE family protein n=1 Tax=Flavobacterium sp. TaxID=239 RepID=UPI00261615AD|nr:NRDE family protein [Flavobacterium sp.]MDD5150288.1 NRDE family protein [Flavobacterium sp.]